MLCDRGEGLAIIGCFCSAGNLLSRTHKVGRERRISRENDLREREGFQHCLCKRDKSVANAMHLEPRSINSIENRDLAIIHSFLDLDHGLR